MIHERTLLEGISHDRRLLSEWFRMRRDIFLDTAAQGLFRNRVNAERFRDELKLLARELDPGDVMLEKLFEMHANITILRSAHGFGPTLSIEDVDRAWQEIERHILDLEQSAKSAERGRVKA